MAVQGSRLRMGSGGGEPARVKVKGRGVPEVAGAGQTARLTATAAVRDITEWTGVAAEDDQPLPMLLEEVRPVSRTLSLPSYIALRLPCQCPCPPSVPCLISDLHPLPTTPILFQVSVILSIQLYVRPSSHCILFLLIELSHQFLLLLRLTHYRQYHIIHPST